MEREVQSLRSERERLLHDLQSLSGVERIFPSGGNFLLVKMSDPRSVFERLQSKGIIVRDRSKERGCEGCLRITVGTSEENAALCNALREVL